MAHRKTDPLFVRMPANKVNALHLHVHVCLCATIQYELQLVLRAICSGNKTDE